MTDTAAQDAALPQMHTQTQTQTQTAQPVYRTLTDRDDIERVQRYLVSAANSNVRAAWCSDCRRLLCTR